MKRYFVLTFALCMPLSAASGLKVLPLDSAITGITVTGPDDPGFQALAASLIPADKMAAAAPYFPESIVVSNNSGQAIEALGVRFANTIGNGRVIHNGQFIVEDSFYKPVMAVGERRIVTLGGPVIQGLIAGRPPRKEAQALPPNLSVSIDVVVYADWRFAGPDEGQHVPIQISEMHADQAVCAQFLKGSEALTLLEQEAAAKVQPPPPNSTDWSAWETQRMADRLVTALHAGDSDFAQRRCAPVLAASNIASALHR